MKIIQPFRALRPTRELAARVASPPYDVINRGEAIEIAKNNPYSFLHINKPEIDVDVNVDVFDRSVYTKGSQNLKRFISNGILQQDSEARFYVYRQIMDGHSQTGVVAVASIDAYNKNIIKKHEYTRPEKEDDRVNHMDALGAQVGPVFLTYKSESEINELITNVLNSEPEYDFEADDHVKHTLWVINDDSMTLDIEKAFDKLDCLYVADGHHRTAAASRVRNLYKERNESHNGSESYNYFLAVLFPHNQMQILDYNRILKDLNGLTEDQFISCLGDKFDISVSADHKGAKPKKNHEFAFYTNKNWYRFVMKKELMTLVDSNDPIKNLDVSIIQDYVLTPLLNINDQRTDKRVDFVGGIRGLTELQNRVDSGDWEAAIALYPTSIESLMSVADANKIMPPKSTWFEPKLKSGLFIHMLD